MTVERKYMLTKISSGDYLLPSNDGQTLYRIHSYIEGPSSGLEDVYQTDTTLWAVSRWQWPLSQEMLDLHPPDPDDWDQWVRVDEWFKTRKAAIEAALSRY